MDSEPINASKKTCLQQSLRLTKPFHLMCQCGLSVWICFFLDLSGSNEKAWRLTSTTVQNRDSAEKRSEEKKNKKLKENPQQIWGVSSYFVGFAMYCTQPDKGDGRHEDHSTDGD